MSESFPAWLERQGRAEAVPYRPWGREHPDSVMVEFRDAPFPGRGEPAGGLLVPIAEIRSVGYAAEEADAGQCHVAWVWLQCRDVRVQVTGYNLAGLVEAFRRGQVDFVQVYSEEQWGEVHAPRTDPLVLSFKELAGT